MTVAPFLFQNQFALFLSDLIKIWIRNFNSLHTTEKPSRMWRGKRIIVRISVSLLCYILAIEHWTKVRASPAWFLRFWQHLSAWLFCSRKKASKRKVTQKCSLHIYSVYLLDFFLLSLSSLFWPHNSFFLSLSPSQKIVSGISSLTFSPLSLYCFASSPETSLLLPSFFYPNSLNRHRHLFLRTRRKPQLTKHARNPDHLRLCNEN